MTMQPCQAERQTIPRRARTEAGVPGQGQRGRLAHRPWRRVQEMSKEYPVLGRVRPCSAAVSAPATARDTNCGTILRPRAKAPLSGQARPTGSVSLPRNARIAGAHHIWRHRGPYRRCANVVDAIKSGGCNKEKSSCPSGPDRDHGGACNAQVCPRCPRRSFLATLVADQVPSEGSITDPGAFMVAVTGFGRAAQTNIRPSIAIQAKVG